MLSGIDEKKIDRSTGMGGPEKCLGRFNDLQNLFDSKAFPRCPHENVKIGAYRFIRQVERKAELRGIPGLTVIMGQHRPETTHDCRRNRDTKLGDITSQEGLNETLAPGETVSAAAGKKRTGKSAPEPNNIGAASSRFVKTKTGKLDEFDATSKGLRNILDTVG
jgi:hypothetical protein